MSLHKAAICKGGKNVVVQVTPIKNVINNFFLLFTPYIN